ncbi:MAG: hypothetical protein U0263_23640 [Polyangiaceae bacterium]
MTVRSVRRALPAIVWAYVFRLLCGWIIASPLARALAAQGATQHPRGDAILFERGGLELTEALRLGGAVLAEEAKGSLLVAVLLGFVSLVPAVGLLSALDEDARSGPSEWTKRGVALWPRSSVMFGAKWFAQGVYWLLAGLLVVFIYRKAPTHWDERSVDLTALGVALLCSLPALFLGLVEEMARIELVRGARLGGALRRAVRLTASRPIRIGGSWLLATLFGAALTVAVAHLVGALDVSRPGSARMVGVFVLHQAAIFGILCARSVWLAYCIELGRGFDGSAPGAERAPVDLEVAPRGPVPARIETHDPPAEAPGGR